MWARLFQPRLLVTCISQNDTSSLRSIQYYYHLIVVTVYRQCAGTWHSDSIAQCIRLGTTQKCVAINPLMIMTSFHMTERSGAFTCTTVVSDKHSRPSSRARDRYYHKPSSCQTNTAPSNRARDRYHTSTRRHVRSARAISRLRATATATATATTTSTAGRRRLAHVTHEGENTRHGVFVGANAAGVRLFEVGFRGCVIMSGI